VVGVVGKGFVVGGHGGKGSVLRGGELCFLFRCVSVFVQ
jgi:hypothetical protein